MLLLLLIFVLFFIESIKMCYDINRNLQTKKLKFAITKKKNVPFDKRGVYFALSCLVRFNRFFHMNDYAFKCPNRINAF